MSKMPFLPYLRMHTLNLESSEFEDVRDSAETTDSRSRATRVGDDAAQVDRQDAYAASDALHFRFSRR